MLTKRTLILAVFAVFLGACNSITEIDRAQKDTGPLKLNAVNVDVSDLNVTTEGRAITKTTAELQEDLRRAIAAEAQKRSVPNGLPANVNVKLLVGLQLVSISRPVADCSSALASANPVPVNTLD